VYLKSVTLKGFKSFAQATTLLFEPGVTAVIGPNGSGKSNVVDALAWVMGEQGAKTLRGGKMEDVIFAGTASRGPLGRAEVQLTIDNSDGALPIEYAEVTISRTLFRNGASEYAINGQSCRLLDVQELLSDSGLGRQMHVIVGQGQLDAILHATPEDRRGFIEEAAGILKHRRRKERTLRKLEAMEANLTRLNDLTAELRRQLKPLGRQAEVAREAQTIAAEARDAKARLIADDIAALRAALAEHARTEQERHSERIVVQEQLEQKRLRAARVEAQQGDERVDGARTVLHGLESAQERFRSLYALATERLALLRAADAAPAFVPRVTEAEVTEAGQALGELQEAAGRARDAWEAAQRRTAQARAELDALDVELAEQSALLSAHELELQRASGRADTAAARVAARGEEVARAEAVAQAATQRAREAAEALAEAGIDEDASDGDRADEREDALAGRLESARAAAREAEEAHERARTEHAEALRAAAGAAARRDALSLALERAQGSAGLLERGDAGLLGHVADYVKVREGWELAVGVALGSLAEAVLAQDAAVAFAAVEQARREELGRVDVLIGDAPAAAAGTPALPGLVAPEEIVTAVPGVLRALHGVLFAEDLAAARAALEALGEARGPELTVVTREGELVSAHLLRGGAGSGTSRIELVAQRDAAQEEAARADAAVAAREAAVERARLAAAAARESVEEAAAALASLRSEQAEARLAAQRLRSGAEAARAEAARAEAALAAAQDALDRARSEAAEAVRAFESLRDEPRPILDASEREPLATALDAAREEEVTARLAAQAAEQSLRSAAERASALRAQHEEDQRVAAEAQRRAVARAEQIARAEEVAAALPPILDSVDRSVAEARLALGEAERVRSEHSAQLHELRREESALRERLQQITDAVHGLELKIYEKRLSLSALIERAAAELSLDEEVLAAEYGPDQPVPVPRALGEGQEPGAEPETVPYDRAQQERRLAEAERKLAALGRINPLALEEFAALEQRHSFLSEQLADLVKSKQDLLTIIADLDERMEGIFLAAFEDTRAAFEEIFPILFPGGSGEIRLTDPENILTTGVEVAVRPAGKKIERLSLLSGGERSLAAVAMLVAIFIARPSPFYIMDEVEAALDDANLGRLLTVFEQLRRDSQLIVITHQKRTMEIADVIYGVSMNRDGVSVVVGQRVGEESARAQKAGASL